MVRFREEETNPPYLHFRTDTFRERVQPMADFTTLATRYVT